MPTSTPDTLHAYACTCGHVHPLGSACTLGTAYGDGIRLSKQIVYDSTVSPIQEPEDGITRAPDGSHASSCVCETCFEPFRQRLLASVESAATPTPAPTPAPPPAPPETILQEAQRLVHGDRQAAYGHPIVDYTRTGRMWGAILGIPDIDPRLCCLMMCAVKISREVNAHKRDNLTDLAGYAACAQMVADHQAEPPADAPHV